MTHSAPALYPLLLTPKWVVRPWGATEALARVSGHRPPTFAKEAYGELWLVSDFVSPQYGDDTLSVVADGPLQGKYLRQLIRGPAGNDVLGSVGLANGLFPGLIKLLASSTDPAWGNLSLQVHPDATAAAQLREQGLDPQAQAKTEVWYILAAQPGATLHLGLRKGVSRTMLVAALEKKRDLQPLIREVPVAAGMLVPVPAGTVHAIGAGIVLVEVQTPSGTTYRLSDWERRDAQGRRRPLHIEEALTSLDASARPEPLYGLATCDTGSFCTTVMVATSWPTALDHPGPRLVIGLTGAVQIEDNRHPPLTLRCGHAALIPHVCRPVTFSAAADAASPSTVLVTTFPNA